MQAGVGPGADIMGPGDPDLEAVCTGVEALLRHGLRPATPREGWTHYLPGRRSGPVDMLLVGRPTTVAADVPQVTAVTGPAME